MSTDETKRKTVCLKLAKNGIYLGKDPSNAKFIPSRDVSFPLKLKEFNEPQLDVQKIDDAPDIKQDQEKNEQDRKDQEESSLQKFFRDFNCCDDSCESCLTCDSSSNNVESNPTMISDLPSLSSKTSDYYINSSFQEEVKQPPQENSSNESQMQCRVEFITPFKSNDIINGESVKHMKPLIVDLSRNKQSAKEPPVKIFESKTDNLKMLNRNFITPKVKVENFSGYHSTALPLVISPAETPNFQGCSSSAPYPSTKIEIDYTGSTIRERRYGQQDYQRKVKMDPKMNKRSNHYHREDEYPAHDNDYDESIYQSLRQLSHQSLEKEGEERDEKELMVAAKALYSKRTRTLFHWINPRIPKTKLKDEVLSSWDCLPDWQKQIYVHQVMGKCGNGPLSPMINPQIMDINGMAEAVMSTVNQSEREAALPPPPRKKRKYTRRAHLNNPRPNVESNSLSSLGSASSVYNFLSSL